MSLLGKLLPTAKRQAKRLGRGIGSGKGGHTASRGMKGLKSRTGGKVPVWFEGGQLPLIKRLPMMRGKGKLKVVRPVAQLSLTELNKVTPGVVTLETLKLEKIIDKRFRKAKIIASGEVTNAYTISGIKVSSGALKAIEKAGGTVSA